MRRRIDENQEMSGQNYFKQEAAKEMALRNSDQSKVPQYAEFEVGKTISPDRLPLNPSSQQLIGANGSDRSGETLTDDTMNGGYRGLPAGPSPYGGGGYPAAVRMPRPYQAAPPVRPSSSRQYPDRMPTSRTNASLNSLNRPPRSNYDAPPLPPPAAAMGVERQPSSVYSDYVPPRRAWGGGAAVPSRGIEDYPDERYRPERPKIDTYNLDRDRMVDNPYVAARLPAEYDRSSPPIADRAPNRTSRRTSETGTMIASYYEDVDPRYDDPPEEHDYRPQTARQEPISPIRRNFSSNSLDAQRPGNVDDEYRSGPRSPAASTSSHFTSVSQRGVNPRWQPQAAPQFVGGDLSRRKPPRNDQMNFLAGNPDFELPVSRGGRKGGGTVSPLDAGRYPMPR
jgi:hypothetical protein